MTKSNFIAAIATATAILGAASTAGAQTCDPDSYSQDPAEFADLAVDDLDDEARSWEHVSRSVVRGDVEYGGIVIVGSGCNYFGMENDPDATWNCTDSGGNVFETQQDLTLTPQVAANRIGFDFSMHAAVPFTVDITLSDGSQRTLSSLQPHPSVWGSDVNYGFFGYCTGDANLTITKVFIGTGDTAIDNVRLGVVAAPECSDNDGDGVTDCDGDCDDADAAVYPSAEEVCDGKDNTCDGAVDSDDEGADLCVASPSCDADSLEENLLALDSELEDALLAKAATALEKIAKGQNETAKNVLGALVNQLEAQAGKKVDADAAADLIACIGAIIAGL